MPRVPERLTYPLLVLTSGALLGIAVKEAVDRREGKTRPKIPLHNPKAFTLEGLTGGPSKGSGNTAPASSGSSSSSSSASSSK